MMYVQEMQEIPPSMDVVPSQKRTNINKIKIKTTTTKALTRTNPYLILTSPATFLNPIFNKILSSLNSSMSKDVQIKALLNIQETLPMQVILSLMHEEVISHTYNF